MVVADLEGELVVVLEEAGEHLGAALAQAEEHQEDVGASAVGAEDVVSECIIRLTKLDHAFMRRSGLGSDNTQKDSEKGKGGIFA